MDQVKMDELIEKVQYGEATEEEEIELLKEIAFSYDVMKRYLNRIKEEFLQAQKEK